MKYINRTKLKEMLEKLRRKQTAEASTQELPKLQVVEEAEDAKPKLYCCEWCGELFESKLYPQSCPQCGRVYTDYVEELDTGMVFGGRRVIREASGKEAEAYYRLRGKGEKRRIRTDAERRE